MADELIEMFPQEWLDLAREVQYHSNIRFNSGDDFEIKLAKIAAYCEVILDGEYTQDDIKMICRKLTEKLYSSRMSIIN